MPARIADACRARAQPLPADPVQTIRCIVDSLALAHRRTVRQAQELSGREVDVIHVVGGGARNALLCQLTADACGLPVIAGPVEATALGNVLVQARALGVLDGGLPRSARAFSCAPSNYDATSQSVTVRCGMRWSRGRFPSPLSGPCDSRDSLERTRHLPIIVLVEPGDEPRLMRGLDMGVNDYLMRPVERNEMLARVRTQIRRKRHSDRLRARLEESVELAVVDPLTGLHNRRYMEDHLRTLVAQAIRAGRPLSLLIADIDHFKAVNDTWGHDVGDKVLRQVAQRFRQNIRSMDLACRFGGEEFVGIMPDLDLARALQVGERLRASIAGDVFTVGPGRPLQVTASVGLAALAGWDDTPDSLIKRADQALYAAKRRGRNRVMSDAA